MAEFKITGHLDSDKTYVDMETGVCHTGKSWKQLEADMLVGLPQTAYDFFVYEGMKFQEVKPSIDADEQERRNLSARKMQASEKAVGLALNELAKACKHAGVDFGSRLNEIIADEYDGMI